MKLLDDIRNFLKRYSIQNTSILVAVSGGMDSIAILHLLSDLRQEFDLELSVAHLDHGIRGESAAENAEFVRAMADELDLESRIEKRPVPRVAEEEGKSLEEAARSVRYSFLTEAARTGDANLVALGHNKNDQAETILMHMIRGAGLRGLGGMEEKTGQYIRPLLQTSRRKIKDYVERRGLDYRFDETNEDITYTRNRIRHDLIPKLEEDYNKNIIGNLVRLGKLARDARGFLEGRVDEALEDLKLSDETSGVCFNRRKLLKLHPYLQKAIIRKLMKEARGSLKDVTFAHIEDVLGKLRKEPASTRLDLPGTTFSLDRDKACFGEDITSNGLSFYFQTQPGETMEIPQADLKITFGIKSIANKSEPDDISAGRLTEVVDWRKVERSIAVRNREPGDRFIPLGMSGEKKLKDFFIDQKVPVRKRDSIPLVCDGKRIIWVVGYRIDDRYKVDKSTEKILTIKARKI